MTESDTKYRKLATEYAKLKAQLPVLRKAIIDEQQKEGYLKDELKEKVQSIRKQEQELESLLFRNEQLSKRVSVLQDELDKSNTVPKRRGRTDSGVDNSQPHGVLNEELQRRIKENEKLHSELIRLKQDTDSQLMVLKDRVDSLEFADRQHSDTLEQVTDKHKVQLDKLRQEKALLEVRAETQEKSVQEAKLSAAMAEDKLRTVEKAMAAELSQARKVIEDKIPFNDMRTPALNSLNVPSHNRRYQLLVAEQLCHVNSLVRDFCEHMSSVFTYMEQRYNIYPDHSLSPKGAAVNVQLCRYLLTGPSVSKSVSEEFRKFTENQPPGVLLALDTATHLQSFTDQFHFFNNFIRKLYSYFTLSLQEECLLPICSQTMIVQNRKTSQAFLDFSNSLDRTCAYLALLSAQSNQTNKHPKVNQQKMLDLLSQALAHLHLTSKGLAAAFNMKSQLETQLPTSQESLASTDQCLIKAFISTSATLAKLSTFFIEQYDSSSPKRLQIPTSSTNKHHPIVTQLQQESSSYLRLLQRPPAPSVPYHVALDNMKTLFSSTESRESLHEQVIKLNSRAAKLEEEKEKWMLEAQLLKIKYDKQQKVLSESNLNASGGSEASQSSNNSTVTEPKPLSAEYSELGQLQHSTLASESDEATREALLKTHLGSRIEELTSQLQLADSKAVAYHAECRALGRRLQISNKTREKCQAELTQANSTISHLQDDLLTIKKNYDDQLSTMSEALASMNGNLASQQDEIEGLKLQLRAARRGKK